MKHNSTSVFAKESKDVIPGKAKLPSVNLSAQSPPTRLMIKNAGAGLVDAVIADA